ncbi:MAG: hypothetical protein ACI4QT_01190, partial [Kiritimatiellia bacterium]
RATWPVGRDVPIAPQRNARAALRCAEPGNARAALRAEWLCVPIALSPVAGPPGPFAIRRESASRKPG